MTDITMFIITCRRRSLRRSSSCSCCSPLSCGLTSSLRSDSPIDSSKETAKRYEDLGYQLTKPELERAYALFTQLADRKKNIYDEDLLAIVDEGFQHLPELFSLKLLQSVASNEGRSTATLELKKEGQTFHDSATGDGPCDAAFRAIDRNCFPSNCSKALLPMR